MNRKVEPERSLNYSSDSVKLYKTNSEYVHWLVEETGQSRASVIRELVDEAIKSRQEKATGKGKALINQTEGGSQNIEHCLIELQREFVVLRQSVDSLAKEVLLNYSLANSTLNDTAAATQKLVVENAILLLFMRDYVYRIYTYVLTEHKVKWTQAQVEEGFIQRLNAARREAEAVVSGLFERSIFVAESS